MSQKTSSYADDVKRIQDIVAELQNDKLCDVDDMLERIKEAAELIKKCQQKLARTSIEIDSVLSDLDKDSVVK